MIATEIIPNLWVGDIRSALDINFLSSHQITTIINCTTKYPFPDYNSNQIRVAVRDRGIPVDFDNMYEYLCKTVPIIYDLLSKGERVLVHCYAGRHRSVTLIVGFLMRYAQMTLKEAMETMQSKWSRIGLHFSSSLCKYQEYLTFSSLVERPEQIPHSDPSELQ